jgi:hypothetical protein
MDQLFGDPKLTWHPQMAGSVARALLETPQSQAQYRARIEQLSDFEPEQLARRLDQQVPALCSVMRADQAADLRKEVGRLKTQISQRYAHLTSELAQPEPQLLKLPVEGATLGRWSPVDAPAQGRMDESADSVAAWHIVAGPVTAASWRSTVRLAAGRYVFEGLVRVRNVTPLPMGKHRGARLRIGGMDRESASLLGSGDWARQQVAFEVTDPSADVELICELRAGGGEAWFAKDSMRLRRTDTPVLGDSSGCLRGEQTDGTNSAHTERSEDKQAVALGSGEL